MKLLVMFLVIFVITFPCVAQNLPNYDINKYCKDLANVPEWDQGLETYCKEHEEKAKAKLSGKEIMPRILSYCKGLADSSGGSYAFLGSCLDKETESRKKVNSLSASPSSLTYCSEMSDFFGGSYSVLDTCLQMDLGAK
jgi:hypothetical protein